MSFGLIVVEAACLPEPSPPAGGDLASEPAAWAEKVVLFQHGEGASDACAVSDDEVARRCAEERVVGPADGAAVELGSGGVIELWFESGPVADRPGDDLRVYLDAPGEGARFIQASRGATEFEAIPLRTGGGDGDGDSTWLADLGAGGVSYATFVRVLNTSEVVWALDAVESVEEAP